MPQQDSDTTRCSTTSEDTPAPSVVRRERYWLKANFNPRWTEVSKEEWIKAERAAGFRPKLWSGDPNYMKVCATGGFGGSGINGTITSDGERPRYGETGPQPGRVSLGDTSNTDPSPQTTPAQSAES